MKKSQLLSNAFRKNYMSLMPCRHSPHFIFISTIVLFSFILNIHIYGLVYAQQKQSWDPAGANIGSSVVDRGGASQAIEKSDNVTPAAPHSTFLPVNSSIITQTAVTAINTGITGASQALSGTIDGITSVSNQARNSVNSALQQAGAALEKSRIEGMNIQRMRAEDDFGRQMLADANAQAARLNQAAIIQTPAVKQPIVLNNRNPLDDPSRPYGQPFQAIPVPKPMSAPEPVIAQMPHFDNQAFEPIPDRTIRFTNNFSPTNTAMPSIKPVFISMNEQRIKPFEFTKSIMDTPKPIKPVFIPINPAFSKANTFDSKFVKLPDLSKNTPKFTPVNFDNVKFNSYSAIKPMTPIKQVLPKLNPQFDMPKYNNLALKSTAMTPIKPVFQKINSIQPMKPMFMPIEPIKVNRMQFINLTQENVLAKISKTAPMFVKPAFVDLYKTQMQKTAFVKFTNLPELPLRFINLPASQFMKQADINSYMFNDKFNMDYLPKITASQNPATSQAALAQIFKPVVLPAFDVSKIKMVNSITYEPMQKLPKLIGRDFIDNAKVIDMVIPIQKTPEILHKNMKPGNSLISLRQPPTSLVDAYVQRMEAIREWNMMYKELIGLSRNVEAITEIGTPVKVEALNETIIHKKAALDQKAKELFSGNAIQQQVINAGQKVPVVRPTPGISEKPVLPNNAPIVRPISQQPLIVGPSNTNGGIIQGLQQLLSGKVFAKSNTSELTETEE